MELDMIFLNISNAEKETDIEKLAQIARTLVTCIPNSRKDDNYIVVERECAELALFYGSRDDCIAFIAGCEFATLGMELCICVDTPSRSIIIPECDFGKRLIN